MPREIIAVGAPIVDHLFFIEDEALLHLAKAKGGMEPLEEEELKKILSNPHLVSLAKPGGSATNTLKGMKSLGHEALLIGKRGDDSAGRFFEEKLREKDIESHLKVGKLATGHALCFITPDGERTMRTYLGASQELAPEDIERQYYRGVRLAHHEGYLLYCPGVTEASMSAAKSCKGEVSLDLSSFEVVKLFRKEIIGLAKQYVDILFANEKEAKELTGYEPKEACKALSKLVPLAIVMMGAAGAYVGVKGEVLPIATHPVIPLDTTGAGDLFASGFLHGYLKGLSAQEAAEVGVKVAREVVQILGAELPQETWERIRH